MKLLAITTILLFIVSCGSVPSKEENYSGKVKEYNHAERDRNKTNK